MINVGCSVFGVNRLSVSTARSMSYRLNEPHGAII